MKHWTNKGYILLGEFSGYYANIPHDTCLQVLEHFLTRSVNNHAELRYTLGLLARIFKTFHVDVSRFTDTEIQAMREGKVDPMLNLNVDAETLTGQKFLDKGLDIVAIRLHKLSA